jgi:hypothetical protein
LSEIPHHTPQQSPEQADQQQLADDAGRSRRKRR